MTKEKFEHIHIVGAERPKSSITIYVMVGGLVVAAAVLLYIIV